MKKISILLFLFTLTNLFSQTEKEIPTEEKLDKVTHVEPLYKDLVRDLGVRKGEREWNVGFEIANRTNHNKYETLVEYEWAPFNRLAFEVESSFSLYNSSSNANISVPKNKLNGIKFATQYTFYVSKKNRLSMAVGYVQDFEFSPFSDKTRPFINTVVYNPFFIVAKRLGSNFHSMIFAGPTFNHNTKTGKFNNGIEFNTNLHYLIGDTKNVIGLEVNKTYINNKFTMVLRPQVRVALKHNLLIGVVAGFPTQQQSEKMSSFLRLIYEPNH